MMKLGNASGAKDSGNNHPLKGNVMSTTETQNITATKLRRIAWLSAKDETKKFGTLMHHLNEDSLAACFWQLDGRKAVGVDLVTKDDYGENLIENIAELCAKMRQMAYLPQPVRRVLIPKEGRPNATRPLGISTLEDKIVQKMMQKILESIYDPIFFDCSYGFRPKRGCHDAIKDLVHHLHRSEVEVVIDLDLSQYFDTINHAQLAHFLEDKIEDQRFMRYLHRMLKAGILTDGELRASDEGAPQGSICSPILANIYAHYVLDDWIINTVQPHCKGQIRLFRYADDAIICCEDTGDAKRIMAVLAKRLAKYHLSLNEEKTQVVSFSKRGQKKGIKQGTFDFLGFTFYFGKSRKGHVIPKLKSCGKRIRSKLKNVTTWIKEIKNRYSLKIIWQRFRAKLAGHIRYYGVSYNLDAIKGFVHRTIRILFKWLNRRSQRRSFTWEGFRQYIQRHPLPNVRIYHPLF